MKRRNFVAGLSALAMASCARDSERAPRYDQKQCPFCTTNPGTCFYCSGTTKCHFCNGTGKRKTVSPDIPERDMKQSSYTEECPYCKGSGKCRYCDGKGKCWACRGTGKIDSWDFFEESKKQQK